MEKIRVAIIDDQTVLRHLLAAVLGKDPRFDIILQSGDGREALEMCLKSRPDFVILDVMLPGLHGSEVLQQLLRDHHNCRVLAITSLPDPDVIRQMLDAGVHGMIEKDSSLEILQAAIDSVSKGGAFFGPTITRLLPAARSLQNTAQPDRLSTREREILQLIGEGYSTKQVADKLGISIKTAENHRTNLMNKLNIHDVASLTRYAIKRGLVSPHH